MSAFTRTVTEPITQQPFILVGPVNDRELHPRTTAIAMQCIAAVPPIPEGDIRPSLIPLPIRADLKDKTISYNSPIKRSTTS